MYQDRMWIAGYQGETSPIRKENSEKTLQVAGRPSRRQSPSHLFATAIPLAVLCHEKSGDSDQSNSKGFIHLARAAAA